jgi:hypothetical protein
LAGGLDSGGENVNWMFTDDRQSEGLLTVVQICTKYLPTGSRLYMV